MIKLKRLETVKIESSTEKEIQDLVDTYIELGYKAGEIYISNDPKDKYPYFCYVHIDEFDIHIDEIEE